MTVTCQACGKPIEAQRSTRKFCDDRCKKQHQRGAKEDTPAPSGLVRAVTKDLTAAGVLDTPAGQQALDLATRMVHGSAKDTGSAYAAMSRELSRALQEAKSEMQEQGDFLDELAEKRQARVNAA